MTPVRPPRSTLLLKPWMLWAGAAVSLALFAASAISQPMLATMPFESTEYRYSVALPTGCRHEEGPGTLDAVCSPELDPDKSADASAVTSLVLEVVAELVPDDAGKASAALAQGFSEDDFKKELPETICGEPDGNKVKIENIAKVVEEGRVVYVANVTCPEIRFLALGERRATARYLITAGLRYRLMARALKEDYELRKDAIDSFFSSFKVMAQEKR